MTLLHGSLTAYTRDGCRCDLCRKANTDYSRDWRARNRGDVPDHREHGTRSTYVDFGCRCDPCRAASADYAAKGRQNRAALTAAGQCRGEHGTISTYNNWACRCDACRNAWAEYKKRRRHRQMIGGQT